MDRMGKKCTKCHKGIYKEISLQDDWSGFLHCSNCGEPIPRHSDEPKKKQPFIPASCRGEKCTMCGNQAYHKVEETVFEDDPTAFQEVGIMGKVQCRHPFTAYLCSEHFKKVMRLKND